MKMSNSIGSSDLELMSVLNKIFFKKRLSKSPIKVKTSLKNKAMRKNISKTTQPKQYIKVNVLSKSKQSTDNLSNDHLNPHFNFHHSPRPFKTASETFGNKNDNYITDLDSNGMLDLRSSAAFKQIDKTNSFAHDQLSQYNKSNTFQPFQHSSLNSTSRNKPLSLGHHRKASVDSLIEEKRKEKLIASTDPHELIILESKLSSLLTLVIKGKDCKIACCDMWSFYIKSSLFTYQENYFEKRLSKVVIHSFSNLLLLIVILSYDISFELNLFVELNLLFKTIFTLIHLNYMLLAKFILSHLDQSNSLIYDFTNYLNSRLNGEIKVEMYENEICLMIKHNSTSIVDLVILILSNIAEENNTYNELIHYFMNISKSESKDLIDFFIDKIFRKDMQQSRGLLIQKEHCNPLFTLRLKQPYLPSKRSAKKYSLLISLDEVLVSFSIDMISNMENGILFLRPGLMNFLTILHELYELILFSSATRDYVKPILKEIEKDNRLFDFCLYREHCSLTLDDRIKDLTKIGRDLSKVILIDNNISNFKLNKQNCILIHSFFGNNSDTILEKLQYILIKIAKESSCEDIRQLLVKYQDEITQTVSSDLYTRKGEDQLNPILIQVNHNNMYYY